MKTYSMSKAPSVLSFQGQGEGVFSTPSIPSYIYVLLNLQGTFAYRLAKNRQYERKIGWGVMAHMRRIKMVIVEALVNSILYLSSFFVIIFIKINLINKSILWPQSIFLELYPFW